MDPGEDKASDGPFYPDEDRAARGLVGAKENSPVETAVSYQSDRIMQLEKTVENLSQRLQSISSKRDDRKDDTDPDGPVARGSSDFTTSLVGNNRRIDRIIGTVNKIIVNLEV